MSQESKRIVICMGSSCFARGNKRNAEAIMDLVQHSPLKDRVQVAGTLCQNRCKQGPNLEIDGECHCGVDPQTLPALIEAALGDPGHGKI